MAWWNRKPKRPAPLGVGSSGGRLGGKSERVNPWPRCGRGCWKRVPAKLIHKRCTRACRELQTQDLKIPLSHHDGKACCPGWCRVRGCGKCWDEPHIDCLNCYRCIFECPGVCNDCGECKDRCVCKEEE